MEFLDILTDGRQYKEQVYTLYEGAYPREEKKPLDMMENLADQGKMELLAIVEDGEFVGLAMNMLSEKTALLDYLAITPEKRCGGHGSVAIQMLTERFKDKKYILEIEMQDDKAENAWLRKRRKEFYLRNGLKETGLFVHAYETDFELITPDGSLDFDTYMEILEYILGEDISTINPTLLKKI